jgi:hypothetical protein
MKISVGDVIMGSVIIALVCAFVMTIYTIRESSKPCTERNIARRAVLIDSHERCMVEENCIYEDWDIRRYDARLARQEICAKEQD